MIKKIRTFLQTARGHYFEHIAMVFGAAFAITAYGNRDHILHAHGLAAIAAAGYAIAIAGAFAGIRAVRDRKLVAGAITMLLDAVRAQK